MAISQHIFDQLDEESISVKQVGQGLYAYMEPGEYECEFWSDAGEDFVFYISAADDQEFINGFADYAQNFDPDDHAALYIPMRGENGVPDSARVLIEDADSIKEFLQHAAKNLRKEG